MHVGISKTPGSFGPARTRSRSISSSCAGTPPKSKKQRYCRVFPWNRPSGPAFHRTAGGAAPPVETRIPPGHPLCSKGCGSEVAGEDTLCPAGSRREPGFVTPDLGGPFSGNGPKAPESEVVVATGRRKRTRGRCPQGCGHEIQGTSGLCRNCDRKSRGLQVRKHPGRRAGTPSRRPRSTALRTRTSASGGLPSNGKPSVGMRKRRAEDAGGQNESPRAAPTASGAGPSGARSARGSTVRLPTRSPVRSHASKSGGSTSKRKTLRSRRKPNTDAGGAKKRCRKQTPGPPRPGRTSNRSIPGLEVRPPRKPPVRGAATRSRNPTKCGACGQVPQRDQKRKAAFCTCRRKTRPGDVVKKTRGAPRTGGPTKSARTPQFQGCGSCDKHAQRKQAGKPSSCVRCRKEQAGQVVKKPRGPPRKGGPKNTVLRALCVGNRGRGRPRGARTKPPTGVRRYRLRGKQVYSNRWVPRKERDKRVTECGEPECRARGQKTTGGVQYCKPHLKWYEPNGVRVGTRAARGLLEDHRDDRVPVMVLTEPLHVVPAADFLEWVGKHSLHMTHRCNHCQSLYFPTECVGEGRRRRFTLCCSDGQVSQVGRALGPPPYLKSLLYPGP